MVKKPKSLEKPYEKLKHVIVFYFFIGNNPTMLAAGTSTKASHPRGALHTTTLASGTVAKFKLFPLVCICYST